jgi:hypothetical protein
MRLAALALLVLAGTALADGEIPLEVELGKKIERNVGYARGWFCDDPTLVQADLVTRGDHNVWIVTGAKLGHTLCRVGTDAYAGAYVFDLHVVAAKKKR